VGMKVRAAGYSDVDRIADLGDEFWGQTVYAKQGAVYHGEQARKFLYQIINNGIVLVAEDDDGVQGFILLAIVPIPWCLDALTATELAYYVTPEKRKGGAGIRLLREAENVAKDRGIKYISMAHVNSVDPATPESVYTRLGYSKTETFFSKDLK